MMAGHDINHLRQIEAILAAKKKQGSGAAFACKKRVMKMAVSRGLKYVAESSAF